MNKRSVVRHKLWSKAWRISPAILLLFSMLLMTAASIQAQREDLNSEGPEKMPDPTVVSQEVMTDGTTQTPVTIPVSRDTYVTSNQPNTNWCDSNWLRLGYNISEGKGSERIYLYFDMNSIPSNATVNWAQFEIYQHTITPFGDPDSMGVESRHLASSWNQCAVTWNSNQPDWGGVIGTGWIPNTIGWISGDVTSLVRQWVDESHPNNGVILIRDERQQERERAFYSSRDFSRYPRLKVNYSVIVDSEPPRVSVNPLPQWSQQSFTVSCGGDDPGGSGIAYYAVQYQANGGNWISWINGATGTSATFVGSNGNTYGFQASGVDKAGNVQPFPNTAQASTTVDTVQPNATVNALPPYIFPEPFTVSWSGTDNLSGIKCYDVQFREVGGPWIDAFECTTDTSVQVSGAENGKAYELRARATDNAGNVQPWPNSPQTETTISTSGPAAWIVPFASPITRADSITVQWQGQSAAGTTISWYNVRYRFERGPWVNWQTQVSSAQATLTNLNSEDGTYCFEAQAQDSQGRLGEWGGQQCIAVDRNPPFIEPQFLLPMLYRDFYGQ
jgi:hypothetical protein